LQRSACRTPSSCCAATPASCSTRSEISAGFPSIAVLSLLSMVLEAAVSLSLSLALCSKLRPTEREARRVAEKSGEEQRNHTHSLTRSLNSPTHTHPHTHHQTRRGTGLLESSRQRERATRRPVLLSPALVRWFFPLFHESADFVRPVLCCALRDESAIAGCSPQRTAR
jgi:hypothetical protein